MSDATLGLFRSTEFAVGFLAGIAVLVVSGMWRFLSGRRLPWGGLAIVLAAVTGLRVGQAIPLPAVGGLILLGIAGTMCRPSTCTLAMAASIPGAITLITFGIPDLPVSVRVGLIGFIVVGSWLAAQFRHRHEHRGIVAPLMAVAIVGATATIPDTEKAIVVTGVLAVAAVGGWPLKWLTVDTGALFALVGLLTWLVGTGGVGRPGSMIGGLASLGLIVVEPVARRLNQRSVSIVDAFLQGEPPDCLTVLAAQLATVVVASRIAGLQSSALGAALIALPALAAVGAWAWTTPSIGGWSRPGEPSEVTALSVNRRQRA